MTQTRFSIDEQSSETTDARRWSPFIIAVICGACLLLWAGTNEFRLSIVILMTAYSFVSLGMYIPVAWVSSLSLAYGAYAAIGAYSVAVCTVLLGWPNWLGWLVGTAVAAIVAIVMSMATSKLTGFYLVAATLLFAMAFETWLSNKIEWGSGNGLSNVSHLELFGWSPTQQTLVASAVAVVVLLAFAIDRLRFSRWGIVARTVGENPLVVTSSGTSVGKFTVVILAVGAAVASLGGAFFVTAVRSITPDTFSLNLVFLVLFMPLIGGIGTPWGALVGAVITVFLTVQFTLFAGAGGTLILSAAVLIILLVAPEGLLGLLRNTLIRLQVKLGRIIRRRS